MTQTEEFDEEAAGDESMTAPGAPTPLSALEVSPTRADKCTSV